MKKLFSLACFLCLCVCSMAQVVYTEPLSNNTPAQLASDDWLISGYSAANGGIYNNGNLGANLWSAPVSLHGSNYTSNATVSFDYISASNSGAPIRVEIYVTNDNMSNQVWAGEAIIFAKNDSVHHAQIILDGKIGSHTGSWAEGDYNLVVYFSLPDGGTADDKKITLLGDFIVAYPNLMPVTFMGFSIDKTSSGLVINWSTASEQNNSYFVIEKSTDGKNFKEIGRVPTQAVNGNSSSLLQYFFHVPLTKE